MTAETSTSRAGILRARAGAEAFHLERVAPSDDLAFFVDRYWIVRWDLRGRDPYPQETLPHPSVHMVVTAGRTLVHGVETRRFSVLLEGKGQVVGTKFKPGGFFPFVGRPLWQLTDRTLPLDELLGGDDGAELERAVLATEDTASQVALVEAYLRRRLPARDEGVTAVGEVTRIALENREIRTVEELAARSGMPARTMQRMFRRYVGVSPKWCIQRFRLHEAVLRAEEGTPIDWAALAGELGYCDQPHFIRDFKAHVGRTPAEHAADCARLAGDRSGARGADAPGAPPAGARARRSRRGAEPARRAG